MATHPQSHRSDPRILRRRTLERDHRYLAGLLRPGLSVLDLGCGTGAITVGIAKAVAPQGNVLGVDRDAGLLEMARQEHAAVPNLRFDTGDATNLPFRERFDIVTAARTLQWISEPQVAVAQMTQAARPSGLVVALDYNHAGNRWQPDPPAAFHTFYHAFLSWRQANHWDNHMADHLPALFHSAGLVEVESHLQDEISERGDPDFAQRSALWLEVIEKLGESLVQAGVLTAAQLQAASECCEPWIGTDLQKQSLSLRAVVGRKELK